YAQSTTLSNGADFIRRLVDYDKHDLLPKTRFATLKIKNFYNMIPHDRIIEALGQFLSDTIVIGREQNLSIETIQQLTQLVLRNNVFTYNDTIYRYVKGSPLSLPLTRTLGNIYLRQWQRLFVKELADNSEFYGRYHDIAFLTWNAQIEKLEKLFNELDQQYPDIRITTSIGLNVHFLGAYIENQGEGHLYTHVHHEPTIPAYVLLYVIGHPRLIYRQWFQWALIRAVCYCSSTKNFDQERFYIELTFLANGYSLNFVNLALNNFLPIILLSLLNLVLMIVSINHFVFDYFV
ncbi:unnamed protein product, partial [Didymodactylos carnosus]